MKQRCADRRMILLTFFSLVTMVTPAWGGGYSVEQLFMLPLEQLLDVTIEMVIPPY